MASLSEEVAVDARKIMSDKCYPEKQPSYEEMISYKPENTKKQVECTCNYLKDYVDFATEERSTDTDVDKLFEKTRHMAAFSVQSESGRIHSEIAVNLTPEGKFYDYYDVSNTAKAIQFDMQIIGKLLDISISAERAKSRLDKVLVIERYIDTAHNDAPLIGEACAEKEMNGDKSRNFYLNEVAQEVLDCLAENENG